MDVDLLRPGTVPISKDTKLWFEFLLNPQLLDEHLANPNGDPTPTDLIVKFLAQSTVDARRDSETEPLVNGAATKPKLSLRAQGLKIIALKVAAFLKWDLDLLMNKLPLEYQGMLVKDLANLIIGDSLNLDAADVCVKSPLFLFTFILFHRWVIKSYIAVTSNKKVGQPMESPLLPIPTPPCEDSAKILWNLITKCSTEPIIPLFSALVPLSEEVTEVAHRWDDAIPIPIYELRCQISAELCEYWMVVDAYEKAKLAVNLCKKSYFMRSPTSPSSEDSYCKITLAQIQGLCIALGVDPGKSTLESPSITFQFINSLATLDLRKLLEKDNMVREVPIVLRDCYELDAMSEVASGRAAAHRDCVAAIKASNMVRRAIAGCHWHGITNIPTKLIDKALLSVMDDKTMGEPEWQALTVTLAEGLSSVTGTRQAADLVESPVVKQLLNQSVISQIVADRPTFPSVEVTEINPYIVSPQNPMSKRAGHERDLVACLSSCEEICSHMEALHSYGMNIDDIQQLNKNWEIPAPYSKLLKKITCSKPSWFYAVLLCKVFELDKMKDYDGARSLIEYMLSDKKISDYRFTQLLKWELLLIDVHQFHSEWPSKHVDMVRLGEECSHALERVENFMPRTAIRDGFCLALLNTGCWQELISSPAVAATLNSVPPAAASFYSLVASACLQIKCNQKPSVGLIDKVLQTLVPGKGTRAASMMTSWMCSVLDATAITVIASLLARIFNIICDDNHAELLTQYVHLWPSAIKDPLQHYNTKILTEMLWDVVNHAVKINPTNMVWSKLLGDLNFGGGHHTKALKCYLEAAIVGSDYFFRPVTRSILEDHVVKNMVKCCISLQCHAQGAVLCQLLEDVDYATAFKALQEMSSWDAMDSYYDCIWDVTLLEFLINLHTRRNEVYRKQKAILMMGLLELNSNNNDEIKREAENIRKARFLRALAKQYVC